MRIVIRSFIKLLLIAVRTPAPENNTGTESSESEGTNRRSGKPVRTPKNSTPLVLCVCVCVCVCVCGREHGSG
jgi:hypothetical protein